MKKTLTFLFSLVLVVVFAFNVMAQDQSSTGLAPQSDGKNSPVFVQTPASPMVWNGRAFGYNAVAGTTPKGPVKFFLNTPSTLVSLSADAGANFLSAGALDDQGNYYAVRYGTFEFYRIDTTTGVLTQIGTMTGVTSPTGMAWDYTTNQMYVLNLNSTSGTVQLGTLNLTTGVWTGIGSPATSGTIIDIGINNAGMVYGHRFTTSTSNSEIVSINKTTNAVTLIGPTGFIGYYAQGMAFDHTTDSCFLSAYNYSTSAAELRSVNLSTGATTLIGNLGAGASTEVDAFTIPGSPGPQITHTPLPNTQNLTGPYVVNCQIVPPAGNTITSAKLLWSRNNATVTDSLNLTAGSGSNYSGNIPGNGSAATYRYYLKAVDNTGKIGVAPGGAPASLYSFIATASDTTKPVITHTTLADVPKTVWPATVNAQATDIFGIDSVWVRWYKNNTGTGVKHFKLTNTSGANYSAAFNSANSDVMPGDSIFYRVFAKDASTQHNTDSTTLRKFKIIAQATACIGTGTTSTSYPFYTLYEDSRTQMLYTSTEIIAGGGGAGFINKIGFTILTVGSPAMSGFSVKMKTTTDATISTWVTSGWTEVYTSSSYLPAGTGLQYIELATPFFWNGTTNLLVEVCFDNAAWSSNSTVAGTTQTGTVVHNHVDGSTGCTLTATSTAATRPNVCLIINTGVGVNPVGSNVPQVYSLSQNYPNPFNPTTKINFAIPKQGLVTMKIYDVLGREVKTLVNEVKAAGTYTVDFNGSTLSSGVYFYKLESNGFTDIKKMMLIK